MQARSPSTIYRVRKFVHRNKARLTLASAISVAVLISTYAVHTTVRGWRRQADLARQVQQIEGKVRIKASELQTKDAEAQRTKWAREVAIPQILEWKQSEKVVSAFKLAREVREVLPDDPVFLQLWSELTETTSVFSNPLGVQVSVRDWNVVEGEWLVLGTTPIESIQLPAGPLRWRFEKTGFVPRESQAKLLAQRVESGLADESKHPGMVGVAERKWGERTAPAYCDVFVSLAAFGGAFLWQISPETNFIVAFIFGVMGTIGFAVFGRETQTGRPMESTG